MRVGVIVRMEADTDINEKFAEVRAMGMESCQLVCWERKIINDEKAAEAILAVDALEVFGEYVRGVHGKDGKYPTDGHLLGEEVPIGQGKVNYPVFIERLKEVGYDGDITIEREISGEEQKKDILAGKEYLEQLIG